MTLDQTPHHVPLRPTAGRVVREVTGAPCPPSPRRRSLRTSLIAWSISATKRVVVELTGVEVAAPPPGCFVRRLYPTRLTRDRALDDGPSWSPGGSRSVLDRVLPARVWLLPHRRRGVGDGALGVLSCQDGSAGTMFQQGGAGKASLGDSRRGIDMKIPTEFERTGLKQAARLTRALPPASRRALSDPAVRDALNQTYQIGRAHV